MTLNSVAIAIVSAPSAADIGLSGIWLSQSTSADQPVARSTGISGTSELERTVGKEQNQRHSASPASVSQ